MQKPYWLYRLFSIGYFQIQRTLPKRFWKRVTILENNESLVPVLESPRIKIGLVKKQYQASFLVRKSVAEKLQKAAEQLPGGINLVLIEGYRSLKHQQESWDAKIEKLSREYPTWDPERIASKVALVIARPSLLANHNCGGALDVTLMDDNGELLDMGTDYPSTAQSHEVYKKFPMFSQEISLKQKQNRKILRTAMEDAGFVWYPGEWWHYCYGDRMWAVYTGRTTCFYGPVSGYEK